VFDWGYWGYVSAFALLAWLPFGLWRFSRVRPTVAAAQVMVWGMMWLPEGAAFDLPALPPFSKYTISAICALVGVWWKAPRRLRAAKIGRGYDAWIAVMVVAQVGTVLTNQDPLHYGMWKTIELPGFTAYDGISAAVRVVLTVAVPCWLGRALLRSKQDLADVLGVLAVAGVVYSIPILYEVRMSPMLHEYVYGYSPRADWSQNVRLGGYRPTVFMGHGLVVGFFVFISAMAAVTLHKAGRKRILGWPSGLVVLYLFGILVLCKAAAALIYAAVGFAVIRYLGHKAQMRLLMLLAFMVVSYPIARIADVFPVHGLLSMAGTLGPDRVQSLQFRFDNEDVLLIKGVERLWFGWGGYARDRVYDLHSAKDLVIQDGHWIAVFGQQGLFGFTCFFALLLVPVWHVSRGLRHVKAHADRSLLLGFGFVVVICSVNMLPNMQLPYLQFFFAAGLAVLVRELPKQARRTAQVRSQRPALAVSRPAVRRPSLRPVWYGDAPVDAYVSEPSVALARQPVQRPVWYGEAPAGTYVSEPAAAASQRPSQRPVWYGDAPASAYVSEPAVAQTRRSQPSAAAVERRSQPGARASASRNVSASAPKTVHTRPRASGRSRARPLRVPAPPPPAGRTPSESIRPPTAAAVANHQKLASIRVPPAAGAHTSQRVSGYPANDTAAQHHPIGRTG
jgi:hypothetical protein